MPKCRLSYTKIYANIQKNGMPRMKIMMFLLPEGINRHQFLYAACRKVNTLAVYIRLFWLCPAPVPLYLLLSTLNL